MASIEFRGDSYRIVFRHAGEKFSRSLKTDNAKTANASLARLEDNLHALNKGWQPFLMKQTSASFFCQMAALQRVRPASLNKSARSAGCSTCSGRRLNHSGSKRRRTTASRSTSAISNGNSAATDGST